MFVLAILKNIFLAALGEKVVAKAFFGTARWLATQSENQIDDKVVKEWEDNYYNGKRKV